MRTTALLAQFLAFHFALSAAGTPAGAIVVAGADTSSALPPQAGGDQPGFPYWWHLVARGEYSAVYLGERWVLTAGHVGAGDVTIRGKRYAAIPESEIDLRTGFHSADLVLFQIRGDPRLPALPLSATRPTIGEEALLLGYGRSGADYLEWRGKPGRYWSDGPPALRWGRNRVSRVALRSGGRGGYYTENFALRFDVESGDDAESQAAQGDSGGAAFLRRDGGWELGGILVMIQRHAEQPGNTAVSGNLTFAADLAAYVDQIHAITGLGPR